MKKHLTIWFTQDKLNLRFIVNKPREVDKMLQIELGEIQSKFADIVWREEPISSGELEKICEKELNWKKPTTYTVLRKLCEKGLFQNIDGIVTSRISRCDFYAMQSQQYVNQSYNGSLPAFIAAFASQKKLSKQEVDEIQRMIDEFRKGC